MADEPCLGDAKPPREIARKVERLGVAKAHADTVTLLVLAVLAGAFVSLGAPLFTVVVTESALGFGPTRLLGGVNFCLGLILVVVAGAELFTGNNLIAIAWASRRIGTREVLRNWMLAYVGNVVRCLGTVLLVVWADIAGLADGAVGEMALRIARVKAELTLAEAFTRGILCNALVCLAVWLTLGARSVTDKILAILFPITAFVAIGFEHSIANWFFLPFGLAVIRTARYRSLGPART
jgi:formate/nitrite transporter